MREELIEKFNKLYDICVQLEEYNSQYEEHEQKIRDYQEQIQQCHLPIVAKVFLVILIMGIIASLAQMIFGVGKGLYLQLLLMIVAAYYGIKKIDEFYFATKTEEIKWYEEEIQKEEQEKTLLMEQAKWCLWDQEELLNVVPDEYLGTLPIGEMRKYLIQKRAETLPEAINLYEEQLHRWKIEEQNNMILESQYRQEERLANIAFYSALSASLEAASMMGRD